jgi:fumarate reductase subunit D
MAKSNEPIWWSLFAAGGVVAALFTPALILITGLLLPFLDQGYTIPGLDGVKHGRIHAIVGSAWGRTFLFVVIALSLFHWAHRFRYTLVDLGLKGASRLLAVLCYGSAIVGTVVAAWVLWF